MIRGNPVRLAIAVGSCVALTTSGCPLRAQIQKDVRARVASLPGVTRVRIDWSELNQEEKATAMDRARRRIAGCAHNYLDAMLREQGLSALPHPAGDDHVRALFMQPFGQHPRLMRRRRQVFAPDDFFGLRIGFNQGKLFAMTEMQAQFSISHWNGNFHVE